MTKKKKELLRALKFLLFSTSAGIIQLGSFALMEELLHISHWIAYLVSLVLSVLWNFTLNRKFTFHSAGNVAKAMLLVAVFYLVFTPLSTLWTAFLTSDGLNWQGDVLIHGLGWNAYVVELGTMAVNFITEFIYQRFVVFGKSIDTARK